MDTQLADFEVYLLDTEHALLTAQGYLGDLRRFVQWYAKTYGEASTLETLTSPVVRAYKQALLAEQQLPATVNRQLASLAAFVHWAQQNGHLAPGRNPVQEVKTVPRVPLAPRWLEKKDLVKFLYAVRDEVERAIRRYPRLQVLVVRDAALVVFILHTGLRIHEVEALTLRDIQLNERSGKVIVRQGKGNKYREVPLNAKVRHILQDYLKVRPRVESQAFFLSQNDEGAGEKTIRRAIGRFAKLAGLKKVSPHTLRHTFAKSLVDSGVGLEKVAALLGHSNLNTTRVYVTPGEQDLADAVEVLE